MATYVPDVNQTSQPTGDKKVKTAAPEFRAIKQKVSQVLFLPEATPVAPLPDAASRAGTLLGFDGSGDPVAVIPDSQSAAALALLLTTGFGAAIKATRFQSSPGVLSDYPLASFFANRTINNQGAYGYLEGTRLDYTGNNVDPLIGSAGFNDNATLVGDNPTLAGLIDHRNSLQAYFHCVLNPGATLAQYSAVMSQLDHQSGTITAAKLISLNNPLGAGAIGSLVGMDIGNLTRASVATNNWGVRSLTNQSFFAELLHFGDTAGTSYARFGYDPAGHLTAFPRPGYAFRIAGAAGDRRLRLGSIGGDSDDSILEQTGAGATVLTPRAGFGTLLQGTVEIGGALAATNLPVIFRAYTVGTLPSAVTWINSRASVSDANAATFNTIAASGGANRVPVFSDGTNWRIG
jgi:hypothetical protein